MVSQPASFQLSQSLQKSYTLRGSYPRSARAIRRGRHITCSAHGRTTS